MPPVDYLSDNGTAITAEYLGNKDWLPTIGDPDEEKQLKYLYVYASPISTLRVFISYNGGDFEYLGAVSDYPQRFDLGFKKCHYIQLKVTESSSNKRFIFEGYLIVGDKVPQRI